MPKSDRDPLSGQDCLASIESLCRFGIRFAGTNAEKQAAEWIARSFEDAGIPIVSIQPFPCLSYRWDYCRLEVHEPDGWRELASFPAAHSPATPPEGLEGELLLIEQMPGRGGPKHSQIKGRVGLIFTSLLFQEHAFREVFECRPTALLVVDDRFPNDWTVAVGLPRAWISSVTCPMVNLSHRQAWELVRKGRTTIRLQLQGDSFQSRSQNVVAELPGRDLSEDVILISGHHDTVLNGPGPDDNASGVASTLALARHFASRPPRRTLRFISFGAEEQLSEGARHYAFSIRDIDRVQMIVNSDSIGALLGQTRILYTGTKKLASLLWKINRLTGFPGHVVRELSPFSDHFPFNLFGIPSVWYYRLTDAMARHFHHSTLETLEVISPHVMEATVRHQAVLVERLANEVPQPVPRRLIQKDRRKLHKLAREWCGLESTSS